MEEDKYEFILEDKYGNILRTMPFSFDEIFKSIDPDVIYEQDSYYLNGKLIDENIDDWVCDFEIIDKRQYTGLRDKNNVDIYKGDICRDRNRTVFIVHDLRIALWVIDIDRMNSISDEVIGNIYENKELLNEQ